MKDNECEICGEKLIDDHCPNCSMNKCMDDNPWVQERKDEDNSQE